MRKSLSISIGTEVDLVRSERLWQSLLQNEVSRSLSLSPLLSTVLPSLNSDVEFCYFIAKTLNMVVIDADYRKAPEAPFPSQSEFEGISNELRYSMHSIALIWGRRWFETEVQTLIACLTAQTSTSPLFPLTSKRRRRCGSLRSKPKQQIRRFKSLNWRIQCWW